MGEVPEKSTFEQESVLTLINRGVIGIIVMPDDTIRYCIGFGASKGELRQFLVQEGDNITSINNAKKAIWFTR
jgi:hypothetical protein